MAAGDRKPSVALASKSAACRVCGRRWAWRLLAQQLGGHVSRSAGIAHAPMKQSRSASTWRGRFTPEGGHSKVYRPEFRCSGCHHLIHPNMLVLLGSPDLRFWSPRRDSNPRPSDYESDAPRRTRRLQKDPEGSRRIVWMIKRMIKQGRQLREPSRLVRRTWTACTLLSVGGYSPDAGQHQRVAPGG